MHRKNLIYFTDKFNSFLPQLLTGHSETGKLLLTFLLNTHHMQDKSLKISHLFFLTQKYRQTEGVLCDLNSRLRGIHVTKSTRDGVKVY